jgi:cell division septation protein DedD
MNLLDNQPEPARDHELTLSTGAILALFFGLVALCAVCFGIGYSVRSQRSPQPVVAASGDSLSSSAANAFTHFKPAPGSPIGSPTAPPATPRAQPAAATPYPAQAAAPAPIVRSGPAEGSRPLAPISAPALSSGYVVQVAAITLSHKDDADLLVAALRAHGYAANAFPEPDRFIHVQVGPYTTRPVAEAMRARLSADGYQPYIK